MTDVPVSTYMHQKNGTLGIPQDILAVFADADKNCGFTEVLNQLTYPPQGKINITGDPEGLSFLFARDQERDGITCNQLLYPVTPAEVSLSIYTGCTGGPCATYSTAQNYLGTRNPW